MQKRVADFSNDALHFFCNGELQPPFFFGETNNTKDFSWLPFFSLMANFAFLDNRYNPASFFSSFSVRSVFICS